MAAGLATAFAFVLCLGLAACGNTTPITVGQNCGSVSSSAAPQAQPIGNPVAAENCFWHAYTQCQSATLTYTLFGVDTGTTHTLTIQPTNGRCVVADAAQGYTANGGGMRFPVQSYTCSGLAQRNGGLLVVGCGSEGNLFVPPPAAPTSVPGA